MSVKKRQHKIKQTNHRPVFKETIKVETQAKNIELGLNLIFTEIFCYRNSTRFTSKYKLKYVKDIKIDNI